MANKPKEANPINRDGYWYLVRRVPKNMVALVGRNTIVWSTGLLCGRTPCSPCQAASAAVRDLQEHWKQLKLGAQTPGVIECAPCI
ncbi:hypothetical protein [Hyphomicrobium sp.]|uniref:hypothetical protein n=1 Tax=Hyphomicrobium sp. TaxID=82 RepID=UPI002E305AD9|nr:hypothetical protein [Hyphomicrobium sp.]HEX2842252.1 hypothetical protein [Hyphomicrobium sp.]